MEEMDELVNMLADFVGLRFEQDPGRELRLIPLDQLLPLLFGMCQVGCRLAARGKEKS